MKRRNPGRWALVACALAGVALPASASPAPAHAASGQVAIFQDDLRVMTDPIATLRRFRLLGVQVVRVFLRWQAVAPGVDAPHKPRFNASDPAAYPAANWAVFDQIVEAAHQDGIAVDFDLAGGAPLWATGLDIPTDKLHLQWDPSPREFGLFVHAVATRYSGHYKPKGSGAPLPGVSFWSIWNEPDYGPSLAPQGSGSNHLIENSPRLYRNLLGAAWNSLQATGHGHDTILFGELAPRGLNYWGVFSGMKPLVFLRALYCVDASYHQLRGVAAAARGCPTTLSGSARFRAANPALFLATGVSDHPYMRWYPPNAEAHPDPDYTTLGQLRQLKVALDRLQLVYGSSRKFPIYDTEFGYITSPPKHPSPRLPWASVATAAYYLNWAEYLSWRDPRLQSFEQYLLQDPEAALPGNAYGGFASGLLYFNGTQKETYSAWRLPLYLPVTATTRGRSLEVWGDARPAYFAATDPGGGPTTVEIQFQRGSRGPFSTLETVPIADPRGYFDLTVVFPAAGTVRLSWTYPAGDRLLAPAYTIYSRDVQVTIH